jgi:putative ABC transport system permease protein
VNHIIYLLSKDFLKLVLVANLIAWPLAYFAIRQWLQGYAFRMEISPWIFLLPTVLVIFIALLTVGLQTLKSARANPVTSLKYE